jgi:hypothetical protein
LKGGAKAIMENTAEKIIAILDKLLKQGLQLNEIFSCKTVSDFSTTDWQKINKGL